MMQVVNRNMIANQVVSLRSRCRTYAPMKCPTKGEPMMVTKSSRSVAMCSFLSNESKATLTVAETDKGGLTKEALSLYRT